MNWMRFAVGVLVGLPVSAQSFGFELTGNYAELRDGVLTLVAMQPGVMTILSVAEDGRGAPLFGVACNGGCSMSGALVRETVVIAEFPAPVLDVDLDCTRGALVVADAAYRVDLDTNAVTLLWVPDLALYSGLRSISAACAGDFYVIAELVGGGTQLLLINSGIATPQVTAPGDLIDVDTWCTGGNVIYATNSSVYYLGSTSQVYTAAGSGEELRGVALDSKGNWATTIDNTLGLYGNVIVNGAVVLTFINQYPGDIDALVPRASAVVRLGFPANANALGAGPLDPRLGEVWTPRIDHTSFKPNAAWDFLALSTKPPINAPTPNGTLLCFPPPAGQIFLQPAGVPFALTMPADCSFLGRGVTAQGGSLGGGPAQLTNALDFVLGL